MRFLLIGGSGYVGGRLAAHLTGRGHAVTVTTRRGGNKISSRIQADKIVTFPTAGKNALKKAMSETDVVVHLAAPDEVRSAQSPRDSLRAGGELTWDILGTLAALARPPAFLFLSTFHVYGANARGHVDETTPPAPVHPYALGKYFGECVTQAFRRNKGLPALCVRLSNCFGAPVDVRVPRWSLVFNDLCRQAATRGKMVLKTSGRQKRNFIPMADAVRGLEFLAVHRARWPEDGIIHLGSPRTLSVREAAGLVADEAERALGRRPTLVVPQGDSPGKNGDLIFDVGRLKRLGFSWGNPFEKEIRDTLGLFPPVGRGKKP